MLISNKTFIKNLSNSLKKRNYKVKTGHLYEILAEVLGYNSWNVAATKDINLLDELHKKIRYEKEPLKKSSPGNSNHNDENQITIFDFTDDSYLHGMRMGKELVQSKQISATALKFISKTNKWYKEESRTKSFKDPWYAHLSSNDEIRDLFNNYRGDYEDPDAFFDGFFQGILEIISTR